MILLVLGLVVAAATSASTNPPYRHHMTGERLVRDMLADPAVTHVNSVRRERAMGYLDGVKDASSGVHWCPAGHRLPHELNYVLIEEIANSGSDKLKGDAAPLVLATLARLYPCPSSRGKS